jgi:SAM-dependent methyltransferase
VDAWTLSEDDPQHVETHTGEDPRWLGMSHFASPRLALVLIAGERLWSPPIRLPSEPTVFASIGAGLQRLSDDGLVAELRFVPDDGEPIVLLVHPIDNRRDTTQWTELTLTPRDLAGRIGRLVISCEAGPEDNSDSDWLALCELVVCPLDEVGLHRARAHQGWRLKHELVHMDDHYDDAAYAAPEESSASKLASSPDNQDDERTPRISVVAEAEPAATAAVPNASELAHRRLAEKIDQVPPNFHERLRALTSDGRPIRIVSLCAGAARIEADLLRFASPEAVEITFVDVNERLLTRAAARMPDGIQTRVLTADVNRLELDSDTYDIAICVSGLHHLIELERVLGQIRGSLRTDGEFWSIGEYVGRNGSRLWPDAQTAANAVFSRLPERLRFHAGTRQVDETLPDTDDSLNMFEGIRAQELEPLLHRFFTPVDVAVRDCFLWRLLNLAYVHNYDMSRQDDRQIVDELVDAEFNFWRAGGRGVELNGVFRAR